MKNETSIESISNLNIIQEKSYEFSLQSLENAINFDKKSYIDYKNEKLRELEKQFKLNMSNYDYERAVIIMKKLIFFNNQSK